MKNISKQLDKLYLEQERELEQAEFTLDAVRNESPIFTVCENQTLSEFCKARNCCILIRVCQIQMVVFISINISPTEK